MRRSLPASLLAVALLAAPSAARAATYTVGNTQDSGLGSLRAAITNANNAAGADTIAFSFGVQNGAQTIPLSTQLPTITGALTITGLGKGPTGLPLLVLNCQGSTSHDGLEIAAGATATITGVSVTGCANDIAVRDGASLTLKSSYLGIDLTGAVVTGSTNGVFAAPSTASSPTSLTLGGPDPSDGNVISGASTALSAEGVGSTLIQNNRIGTNLDGTQSAGGNAGIAIAGVTSGGAPDLTIADNLIAGASQSTAADLRIDPPVGTGSARPIVSVERNRIGTSADGTAILTTGADNVDDHAPGTVIQGNLIAGAQRGVVLLGSGSEVQGNQVCLNLAGTAALPAASGDGAGIVVTAGASNVLIGGPDGGEGNFIAGCGGPGIETAAAGAVIQGNSLGLATDSTKPVPNGDGVLITGTGNVVEQNQVMTRASHSGISVVGTSAVGNQLLANLIAGGSIGIDLGSDGATPNDQDDPDTGPNGLQNFPVISGVAPKSVTSTINTKPHTAVRVQAFRSNADGTAALEGLGEATVTTDDTGSALVAIGITVDASTPVIETATTADGTSEFSAPVLAVAPSPDTDPGVLLPIVKPVTSNGSVLLPIVAPPGVSPTTGKANTGSALPVVIPDVGGLGLQAVKLTSDGKHIKLVLKNTYVANAVITVGGTDQAPAKKSGKKAKALKAVTHKLKAGKSVAFSLTVPSATKKALLATIKKQGYAAYRPTLTVTNTTTKSTKTQLVGIRAQR